MAASPPPDYHYVFVGVTDGITTEGYSSPGVLAADYTDLELSRAVRGRGNACAVCNEGGSAKATADLASGTMRLDTAAWPDTHNAGRPGGAFVEVGLGARIFLSGPSDVTGKVKIVTHAVGSFYDPDTYGNGGLYTYNSGVDIDVESGQSDDGLGYVGPSNGLVFSAVNGMTNQLTCDHCRRPTADPLPVSVTAQIPFAAGQPYVDFAADLVADVDGAATASIRVTGFSIELPPGFTYTSTLAFRDR